MAGRVLLEVHPHPRGPWLVRAGGRALAVPPSMGRALLPLHGAEVERVRLAAGLGAGLGAVMAPGLAPGPAPGPAPGAPAGAHAAVVAAWLAGAAGKRRERFRAQAHASDRGLSDHGLPVRVPLLPAAVVRRACRALSVLAAWPALALLAVGGLAAVLVVRPWSGPCQMSWPAFLMFAAGALWHELGHAAALRREGYAPGGIGAGILVCVPVLYADVSAASLLPRPGRLRVDLAGLAFQTGAAGVLALAAAVPGVPPAAATAARAAAVASRLAVGYGLLPLPRTDGSWALRDALDPGPDAPPGPAVVRLRRGLHIVQSGLLGLACVLLPARLFGLLVWAGARVGLPLDPRARAAATGLLAVLALAWWLSRTLRTARVPISRVGRASALRYHTQQAHDQQDLPVLDADDESPALEDEPATMALDGVLDLHQFAPGEARALVDDWLDASCAAGLRDLRIIHGKGIGAMRTMVHAALAARPDVESYGLAHDSSSWGATVIRMKP